MADSGESPRPTGSDITVSADRGRPSATPALQSQAAPYKPGRAATSNPMPPLSPSPASAASSMPPPPNSPRPHPSTSSSSSPSSSAPSTIIPAPEPSYLDALRTIRPGELATVYQKPCARESLLTGIGAGFGVGGVRFILGWSAPFQVRQWRAMSWAVGAFVLTSAGAHAFCQRRRALEKAAMQRANQIMEEKRRQKREEAENIKEQRGQRDGRGGGGGGGKEGWGKWVGWK